MQGLTLPGARGPRCSSGRQTFIYPLIWFQPPSVPGQQAGGPSDAHSSGPAQLTEGGSGDRQQESLPIAHETDF